MKEPGFVVLGKYLLPGGGRILEDWGIAVTGTAIAAVETNRNLVRMYPDYEVIDRSSTAVISPGFVNAHMHCYGILSHGITPPAEICDFEAFLNDFWWPLVENRIDHSMIAASGKAAAYEMIESGVTAFCDILEAPQSAPGALEALAAVLDPIGIRAVLSFEACERISQESGAAGIAENFHFYQNFRDHCRIGGMMSIHTTFTASKRFIAEAAAVSKRIGSRFHMHLSESSYEPAQALARYGKLPVEIYDELNVLSEDVTASQGVKLSQREIEILAARQVNLVHMPLSNCEVGGGIAPVPDLLDRGLLVGLGTDGYINNFFEVMRGAFLIHKADRENPETMPADLVFRMATEYGARMLGIPGGGRLFAGGPADFITVAADLPTPINEHNIFSQLILYRNPHDVIDVCVEGRFLKQDRTCMVLEKTAALREVHREAERLWSFPVNPVKRAESSN